LRAAALQNLVQTLGAFSFITVLKRATYQILPNSAKFHQIPSSSTKFRHIPPNSTKFCRVIKVTNYDFPSLGWKIAIDSLTTSALVAVLASLRLLLSLPT